MKLSGLFLAALSLIAVAGVQAQDLKIGYANVDFIIAYMPETQSMQQSLATYEKKLAESLRVKQTYAQSKYQEYLELAETEKDTAILNAKQRELMALDQEIQKAAADADKKLNDKRQEMLSPIIDKLQTAIDSLSSEEKYSFILNSTDSNGTSIILYGPKEHDVTFRLMKRLGITIPEETEVSGAN